jgi:hypothetical protein
MAAMAVTMAMATMAMAIVAVIFRVMVDQIGNVPVLVDQI